MRKMMASAAMVCCILFLTQGFPLQHAKAEEGLSVEGVWEVMSAVPPAAGSRDLGKKLSIVRKGDDYEVKWLDGWRADGTSDIFGGSPWQLAKTTNLPIYSGEWAPGEAKGDPTPETLARECAGITYPRTVSYTLSGNGTTLERSQDAVQLFWKNNHYTHHEIRPGYLKERLQRISGPVNKEEPAVASVESRGEFHFLTKDGRKVSGAEASKISLEEGTKVVTGKDGHVRMSLPDNTTFTIGPNSDMVIDEFVYDPDKSPKKVIASMTKGLFRWVTGKVEGSKAVYKDPEQMKVKLPIVAVGIRGTDFEATVRPDGSGSVVLNFGQLEITEKKTGFKFILDAGQKVTFTAEGTVSRPSAIDR
jgi:hypothetical protein